MTIRGSGRWIEFEGENGIRHLCRITAIQMISDSDELQEESYVVIAGRMLLVREPLDDLRNELTYLDAQL